MDARVCITGCIYVVYNNKEKQARKNVNKHDPFGSILYKRDIKKKEFRLINTKNTHTHTRGIEMM